MSHSVLLLYATFFQVRHLHSLNIRIEEVKLQGSVNKEGRGL